MARELGSATFVQADLSSVKATREAGRIISDQGPLHFLVNNVGGMWPDRWESAEEIEAAFALNNLAPASLRNRSCRRSKRPPPAESCT